MPPCSQAISVFHLSKLCLPHLRKTKGNIINVSSMVGIFGQSQAASYVASKGVCDSIVYFIALICMLIAGCDGVHQSVGH